MILTSPTDQVQHIGNTAPPVSYLSLSYGDVLQIGVSFLAKGLLELL